MERRGRRRAAGHQSPASIPTPRRRSTGEKFALNIDHIEQLFHSIEPFEQSRVEKIRARLEERLAELTGVDL